MAAYIIVEVETTDEALMAEYRKHTPGAVAKFGGKFIVRGGKTRTLEGGWTPSRIVVLEFPDYEKAEAFYIRRALQADPRDAAEGRQVEGHPGRWPQWLMRRLSSPPTRRSARSTTR